MRTLKDIDDSGCELRLWCYACQRSAEIDSIIWMDFVDKGWSIEVDEARKRFTCKRCKSSKDVLLVAASPNARRQATSKSMVEAIFFHHRSKKKRGR
ncbi:hypothetical protein ACFB49_42340 [Sphingomonas sp. DBB INV C78]|uniref:hypothetical protein n=1 Tax=Sphingomonas sp. DBB INV C78 TaxID=3349434 RepID=UPI0036D2C438